MLCDNCGKREANVMYSENINGVKKELHLCQVCSEKLGIGKIGFSVPMNFSNFFGDFIDEVTTPEFMPLFQELKTISCNQCGYTFDDIVNTGKLGCGNCYTVFGERLAPILKRMQGSNHHVGRIGKIVPNEIVRNEKEEKKTPNQKEEKNEMEKLQEDLKQAIKEERYEDAAKIRDEIKKMENK